MIVYPNPNPTTSGQEIFIRINTEQAQQLNPQILDATGKSIDQFNEAAIFGTQDLALPYRSLAAGFYFTQIRRVRKR